MVSLPVSVFLARTSQIPGKRRRESWRTEGRTRWSSSHPRTPPSLSPRPGRPTLHSCFVKTPEGRRDRHVAATRSGTGLVGYRVTMQALRGAAIFVLLLATVAACGGGDARESGTPAVAASRPAGWSLVAPCPSGARTSPPPGSADTAEHHRNPWTWARLPGAAPRPPARPTAAGGSTRRCAGRPCGATAAPASVLAPLQI